jgi:hypothetical protein
MKQRTLWLGLLVVAVMVGLLTFTPAVRAQSQRQQPSTQQEPSQQQSRTFVGQIVKAQNGRYALLTDRQKGTGFYLDDQEKAKQFEGKVVKVEGILDAATNTIHVSNILPA